MRARHAQRVTVVIPTYNSARFITQAVQSVMEQTLHCHEVIVIDDGSTDNTEEVLRNVGAAITYLYQEHRGPSAARNTGLRAATGEYVCFLDADDVWMPHKLETQLDFMTRHPDIGLMFGDEEEWEGDKAPIPSVLARTRFYPDIVSQTPIVNPVRKLLIENFIPTSTVMVTRRCLAQCGLFDESLRVSEDRDLWTRIAAQFGIGFLPLVLAKKRSHAGNISRNAEVTHRSRIATWKKTRQHFPDLAPAPIVDHLLAQTHLELGYLVLSQGRRKEALAAALSSLKHALRSFTSARSRVIDLDRYSWLLLAGLIGSTLIGYSAARTLRRTSAALMRRDSRSAKSRPTMSSAVR